MKKSLLISSPLEIKTIDSDPPPQGVRTVREQGRLLLRCMVESRVERAHRRTRAEDNSNVIESKTKNEVEPYRQQSNSSCDT